MKDTFSISRRTLLKGFDYPINLEPVSQAEINNRITGDRFLLANGYFNPERKSQFGSKLISKDNKDWIQTYIASIKNDNNKATLSLNCSTDGLSKTIESNATLTNVTAEDPTEDKEVANKKYVDDNVNYWPTGTIMWFYVNNIPLGWVLCNGHWYNEDGTQSSETETATCTIHTPDLIGRYPLGWDPANFDSANEATTTEKAGAKVEAGLPNITGQLAAVSFTDNATNKIDTNGAFSIDSDSFDHTLDLLNTSNARVSGVLFDANASNTIYGNSDTVTPPSTKLVPCMKLPGVRGEGYKDTLDGYRTPDYSNTTYITANSFRPTKPGIVYITWNLNSSDNINFFVNDKKILLANENINGTFSSSIVLDSGDSLKVKDDAGSLIDNDLFKDITTINSSSGNYIAMTFVPAKYDKIQYANLPVGSIMWFNLPEAPRGWVVCDGNYYNANGEVVNALTPGAVQTPNLIGNYPLGANDNIGDFVSAGLPNIVGAAQYPMTGSTSGAISSSYSESGFQTNPQTTVSRGLIFDASQGTVDSNGNEMTQSDSPYGKSNTVTPPSVKLLPCMKIAEINPSDIQNYISSLTNIELDWDNVTDIRTHLYNGSSNTLIESNGIANYIHKASSDGIIVVHCQHNTTKYHNCIYTFNEATKTEFENFNGSLTDFAIRTSTKWNTAGGHWDAKYASHIWLPVKKDEYYFLQNDADEIWQAWFIPFKQKVTAPAPCVSYVVETWHNDDNTTFYRKYSDGYIEQWGTYTKGTCLTTDQAQALDLLTTTSNPTRNNYHYSVDLPTPFSTSNYMVNTTVVDTIGYAGTFSTEIRKTLHDKFIIGFCSMSQTTDGIILIDTLPESECKIHWKACGY